MHVCVWMDRERERERERIYTSLTNPLNAQPNVIN